MTRDGLHWLTIVGTCVFVLAACGVLALSTLTFVAVWVGRTPPPPRPDRRSPIDPDGLL